MLNSRKYERLRKNELQSEDATVSKPLHSRESKSSQIVDPKVDESKLTQGADALFEPTFKGEQNKENEVSEVINSMQKLQSSGSLESIWDDHVCICRDFSFFLPNTLGLNDFFWGGGIFITFIKTHARPHSSTSFQSTTPSVTTISPRFSPDQVFEEHISPKMSRNVKASNMASHPTPIMSRVPFKGNSDA